MHHHVEGRLLLASGLAVDHVVVNHGDHGPQAGFDDGELHRVVVLFVFRPDGPSDALVFDLAEELHAVIGETLGGAEKGERARVHIAFEAP